jgi:hypothetical protein
MYLERFEIEDIKCFAEKTGFDFTQPDRSIKKWNVILGENGTGKSTLLQAIALTLAGPEAARLLLPRPEGWTRREKTHGAISATIHVPAGSQLYGVDKVEGSLQMTPLELNPPSSRTVHYTITGNLPYETPEGRYVDSPTIIERVDDDLKYLARTAYSEHLDENYGWLACGYGPFRRLSGGVEEPPSESKAARFFTLFREGVALHQRLQWLQSLYFQAQEEPEGVITNKRWLETIKNTLEDELFPDTLRLEVNAKGVFFEFKENGQVPALHLSDGYRSMLALVLDLLHWATKSYPITYNPLRVKGVVLIDEIDAHLHPSWQRHIGFWLQDKFPNLQFIVTSHSPFFPSAADSGAIFKLQKPAPGADWVEVSQEVDSVQGWRFEQILVSPLFNLNSTRDPESEAKMQTHARLTAKLKAGQGLAPAEEKELAEVTRWLEENLSPPGDSVAEMERYQQIQSQVKELLNNLEPGPANAQS